MAVLLVLMPQFLALFLIVDTVLARRRLQRLHEDLVRAGLARSGTFREVRALLADVAATHPAHLGRRIRGR